MSLVVKSDFRHTLAIEGEFPFADLSQVAEIESWRKEVYRPIYYLHKWWARRLGSVFRAVILASALPNGSDIMDLFYKPVDLDGIVIFDPFMGSGTTIGEASKLGCTVIGRDINPVAYHLVKTALSKISRVRLLHLFSILRERVAGDLLELYTGLDGNGAKCNVLYYFWVKVLPCPLCHQPTSLFSTYLFARHTYPRRHPQVHIVCPDCGHVFAGDYNARLVKCTNCGLVLDPRRGNAGRTIVTCRHCGGSFPIAKTALAQGHAPAHRMYAKLILRNDGNKEYLPVTDYDRQAYKLAEDRLRELNPPLPHVEIAPGYNTRQVLNYGYKYWDEMFNARQLLALSILAGGIRELPSGPERDALMLLFSGVLEFNNMFASYKGEGTGAVRHMFSHHILKPERMPIEANVWGTSKSSGSFSTLFQSRILGALNYKQAPYKVSVQRDNGKKRGKKVFGVSAPIGQDILDHYPDGGLEKKSIYLSCGTSSQTDLPSGSVDLVITDPPFFDNVHYAELADFFHVWQKIYFDAHPSLANETTRHPAQVQDTSAEAFARKLSSVFSECQRVLCDDGRLVFSYHHSRQDGWLAVADAVLSSGFSFVQAQPVKSEMSVATPKSQTKNPIDIDVFLVCRKQSRDDRQKLKVDDAFARALRIASLKIGRFNMSSRRLSLNDVKVVLHSQLLVELAPRRKPDEFLADFESLYSATCDSAMDLWNTQDKLLCWADEMSELQPHLF